MAVCSRRLFQASVPKAMFLRSRCLVFLLAAFVVLGGCGRGRPGRLSGAGGGGGRAGDAKVIRSADDLRSAVKQANVVICVIDAARADHVGCYGYPRPTTPTLDRLASEAVVFDSHFSQIPMTKLSTVSLLTGLYPDTHLAYLDRTIPPNMFTLEKGLRKSGFRTALFSANVYAAPNTGVGSDFDLASTTLDASSNQDTGNPEQPPLGIGGPEGVKSRHYPGHVLGLFSDWLGDARKGRFLAYIHILPPHKPYAASKEDKRLFNGRPPNAWSGGFPFPGIEPKLEKEERLPLDQWVNLYDANLRWADEGVAELVRMLSEAGVLDNTLLIVTSDHGEAFGEHGYLYHSFGVYDELLHVPLLVRFPQGNVVGRISALTQIIDVTPTICDLLGIPYPSSVQGRSMLPLMTGESDVTNKYVFARALGETPAYLVRGKDRALMLYQGGVLRALFDLRDDPKELANVIDERSDEAKRLLGAFRGFANEQVLKPFDFIEPGAKAVQAQERPRVKISEDTKKELRALGYVE